MSAASESAASPSPCACTNISLMQLFHELKQKFPGVPDHVVSNTIELYCHDKNACETHLHSEAKASLTHAYHASSSAAAKQLNELKVDAPLRCRNQPLLKQQISLPTQITASDCQEPQNATLSNSTLLDNEIEEVIKHELSTDANQNVVEVINNVERDVSVASSLPSPVTVINLDNCIAKYCTESPSDIELTDECLKQETKENNVPEKPEFLNYKILKSNKIKHNLHERLEKGKEKKVIKFREESLQPETSQVKPKRPNTLEFIKPNPEIAFKPNLPEPQVEESKNLTPVSTSSNNEPKTNSNGSKTNNNDLRTDNNEINTNNNKPINSQQIDPYWQDHYPLNLSVNVNCHMDLTRGYSDPWLEDFESPRAITSLNLTVCTPTSSMASPVRDRRDEDGFESHFTVTVSPNAVRPPPRRKAPPPPPASSPGQTMEGHRMPSRTSLDSIGERDRSLIERQKARLNQLAEALKQERSRLHQLRRETSILAAPTDSSTVRHLRAEVHGLREQCDSLVKEMEINDTGSFYRNIYTGQRPQEQRVRRPAPPPPGANWQCHMCTFRNHPLLDKCEECDMPRILVGMSQDHPTQDSGFGSLRERTASSACV